jgi:hypothetical protein
VCCGRDGRSALFGAGCALADVERRSAERSDESEQEVGSAARDMESLVAIRLTMGPSVRRETASSDDEDGAMCDVPGLPCAPDDAFRRVDDVLCRVVDVVRRVAWI